MRVQAVGLNWDDWTRTTNECKDHPAGSGIVKNLEVLEKTVETTLRDDLRSFGRGFTTFEQGACSPPLARLTHCLRSPRTLPMLPLHTACARFA